MTNSDGQSYTAKLDGTEAAFQGDPGMTGVLVKRIDKNTIEGTGKLRGKVVAAWRSTVSPDGKMLTTSMEDKETKVTQQIVAKKQ